MLPSKFVHEVALIDGTHTNTRKTDQRECLVLKPGRGTPFVTSSSNESEQFIKVE